MNELAHHDGGGNDLFRIADVFSKSGMFPDARDAAVCAAKLIVGDGMGLNPYESMTGLNFIKGKPSLAAATMAAAIKRSGKYDYRAVESTTECRITFYDMVNRDENGKPLAIGTTVFTMDDAKRAGLRGDNWTKYPSAMLFARCISKGYKTHCPDALGAAPVYVEQEGETEIPQDRGPGGANEPAPVIEQPEPRALPDRGEQVPDLSKVVIMGVEEVKRGKKTKYLINSTCGTQFETFSKTIANRASAAGDEEQEVSIEWMPIKVGTKVFREIEEMRVSTAEKPTTLTEEDW